MKTPILLFTIILAGAALAGDRPRDQYSPLPEGSVPGRFALLAATHDVVDLKGPATKQSVFRIDTATGKVWRLVTVRVEAGGKVTDAEGWSPVFEDLGDHLTAVRKAQPSSNP